MTGDIGHGGGGGFRPKIPAHPGGFVRREVVEPLGLSVTGAAVALSPEMALRIGEAFGVSMDALMRMRNSHDVARARARARGGEIAAARYRPPVSEARAEAPP